MKTYYQTTTNNLILHNEDGSGLFLSDFGPGNNHYAQVMKEIEDGEAQILPYMPPPPTWEIIRGRRNALLFESDWAIMADADPKPNKETWLVYRQALRDVPQSFSTPEAVVWPTKPS